MCLQVSHLLQRVEASIRKHFNGIVFQPPAHIAPHAPTNAPPRPPDASTQASRSGATHDHHHHHRTDAKFHFTCGTHHQDRVSGMEGEGGGSRPRFVCRETRARTQFQKKKRCGRRRGGGGRRSRECRGCGRKGEKEEEETKAKHCTAQVKRSQRNRNLAPAFQKRHERMQRRKEGRKGGRK